MFSVWFGMFQTGHACFLWRLEREIWTFCEDVTKVKDVTQVEGIICGS